MLNYRYDNPAAVLTSIDARIYANRIDHEMHNDDKPTSLDNPNRMPPFALDIGIEAVSATLGGRLAFLFGINDLTSLHVGTDFYSNRRDAQRTIARRDNDIVLFVNNMWPDASIQDFGLFTKLKRTIGDDIAFSGTLRYDLVSADADSVSTFFHASIPSGLKATEHNFSAASSLSFAAGKNWVISLGAGTTVRTADAAERYSDRTPSTKVQLSGEFVGNPALDPERSLQLDLWLEGRYSKFTFDANLFVRRLHHYITVEPTTFSPQLPANQGFPVYSYVNSEADFWGAEVASA